MMLVVDIGNTRVKWARHDGRRLAPQQAAEHAGWTEREWREALFGEGAVDRIVVATVAGAASLAALEQAARAAGASPPEFARVSASAAGVTNGYADPALLGVDRWLAVIAAHHRTRRACCVVDVGTAATVDAVTADGRHLGGFIVPGPVLMTASLMRGTSNLERHAARSVSRGDAQFADNTRDAIERGCVVMLGALVDRCVAELERVTGDPPGLLLTGGAAPLVAPCVTSTAELIPDLVLQGLVVLAGHIP